MTPPPPRTRQQRKQDTLSRLTQDIDAWIATADGDNGTPYGVPPGGGRIKRTVPLSFQWDGKSLVVATPSASPTARNLVATGKVRVGVGTTRDVVLIEGTVDPLAVATEIPDDVGDAFAARTGFDPRTLTTPYRYFRIHPQRLQAWRESNELTGRELMRDGQWTVPEDN